MSSRLDVSASRRDHGSDGVSPRVLMLGKGWFPEQLGGLDRTYRGLFEAQASDTTQGLVIGPAAGRPPRMHAVSEHEAPLWRRLAGYWRVANRLTERCEVIDAHFALYAAALTVAGRARHRPWVVHFHGPWAVEAVVQGDASRWRYVARRAVERRVYVRAEWILVHTSAFRQELASRYRVPPWNVEVVPPGVALDRFAPGDRRAARAALAIDDAFVVACARRLVPRMGIEHLLEAWKIAAERGLPKNARLLIAGDGPLRGKLAARIDELGLSSSAQLLGRISDEKLVALYRAADVNVVPTVEQEGFGLIVLEAAACGTPSIVTSVGGLPEAVGPLDRSLVVPPGNDGALAERILAAQRGALPNRDATRAYAERFSWPEMAARREAIYRRAASLEPDHRLRVVYLDHVARLSGGELALLRLLPHLREVNAHVILFEDGPFAARLREAGISVEILPLDRRVRETRKDKIVPGRISPRLAWATGAYTVRLARRLRRLDPDLVHTNSLKAGVIGSVAARLVGVPVVWHLHDRLAGDYLPAPTAALMRWWMRTFATRVIANSSHTAATLSTRHSPLLRMFTTAVPEVSVVPALATPFEVAPQMERREGFTVGMIGRLAPWKGQDIFLKAFARAFPDGAEQAVIVGSAMFEEDDFAVSLPRLAAELGIADRVEWRGFVEDIPRELAGFDVLVHASRVAEPFGQVVLEAFAAGVAMVAADDGGPQEIIRDGHDGLLCLPGDIAAFAAALTRLREDSDFRERIAAAGHKRLEDFSPSAVTPQVMEVYRAVAGDGGR